MIQDQAATRIQSAYRGYRVRCQTFFSSRIQPLLVNSNRDLLKIAQDINEIIRNKENWGKWFLDDKQFFNYTVSNNGRTLSLQFYLLNVKHSEGTFRYVFPAQTFDIELRPTKKEGGFSKSFTCNALALIILKENDFIDTPISGMRSLRFLNSKPKPPNIYLVDTPRIICGYIYSQSWFQSDFFHALATGVVNVDADPSKGVERIPYQQFFHLLEQVAISVNWIHEQGAVHRDLKESNINLKKVGEEFRAYIADFDLIDGFGYYNAPVSTYYLWDPCFQYEKINTPFCDWFSVATILVGLVMFCEGFYDDIKQFRDSVYYDFLKNEIKGPSHYFWGEYDDLEPFQKEAYQLLYDTCIMSINILYTLKENKRSLLSATNAEDVWSALNTIDGLDYVAKVIKTIKSVAKDAVS